MRQDRRKWVAIVGGRDIGLGHPAGRSLMEWMAVTLKRQEHGVVSGGAPGIDTIAEAQAAHLCLPRMIFPANWTDFGKRAGPARNAEIVLHATYLVAVWDGQSRGTRSSLNLAKVYSVPRLICYARPDGRVEWVEDTDPEPFA